MNIRRILWVLVPILFRITLAHAQTTDNARALTEETLRVEASSATVQQWLSRIETGLGIVISYNPAQIDVDKVRRIDRPGVYTVGLCSLRCSTDIRCARPLCLRASC